MRPIGSGVRRLPLRGEPSPHTLRIGSLGTGPVNVDGFAVDEPTEEAYEPASARTAIAPPGWPHDRAQQGRGSVGCAGPVLT